MIPVVSTTSDTAVAHRLSPTARLWRNIATALVGAVLLAVGFLRLKRRTGCLPPAEWAKTESAESSKHPADSTCNPLEHSPLCQSR